MYPWGPALNILMGAGRVKFSGDGRDAAETAVRAVHTSRPASVPRDRQPDSSQCRQGRGEGGPFVRRWRPECPGRPPPREGGVRSEGSKAALKAKEKKRGQGRRQRASRPARRRRASRQPRAGVRGSGSVLFLGVTVEEESVAQPQRKCHAVKITELYVLQC